MHKPPTIEWLYLDFDGFFASVMQQAMPALRGKPVGVIPFDIHNARSTTIIACSKEAKARGISNVMRVVEARRICPDLVLIPQRPDLFQRAHIALVNEIGCEIPVTAIKSIDELCCKLDPHDIGDPLGLARRIKARLKRNIGPYITCSVGFAANRLLAKIACAQDKPDGVTVWHPEDMPHPLLPLGVDDVPGRGKRMAARLEASGICTIQDLWDTQPKQLRAIWGNVQGERLWYALHGYDLHAQPTERGMYGHGRVLPPSHRKLHVARDIARLLLTKAARRMRRDGFYAGRLSLYFSIRPASWGTDITLPQINDEPGILAALETLWQRAEATLPATVQPVRVFVTLHDLTVSDARQLDLLDDDSASRQRAERLTDAMDDLNSKFGKRIVTLGVWKPPPGGNAGGKIAFTRIPDTEDFE
ncbi:MAG: DNA polymerase IV [Alphaproteobacteria bacterium]